jgi:hypothetical protein
MARLRAEARAPYRGLRMLVYVVFGASGLIGAVVFLSDALAGRAGVSTLPNLALQLGVIALMVWLFRIERRAGRKHLERERLNSPE